MKILITGAQGQIGTALTHQLNHRKIEYLALSHSQLDITGQEDVHKIISGFRPDLIINTAAYTAVDAAESDVQTAYAINSEGVANLAKSATANGSAIFHLSTDYVFSGDQSDHYSEADLPAPINVYGKSKLAGEIAAATTPKHLILRTAWVFSEKSDNFITRLLRLGYRQPRLDIVSDQFGSPTYAGDVASTLLKIADVYYANGSLNWGIYHYAGQPSVSRLELTSYLFNRVNQLDLYGHTTPELHPTSSLNNSCHAKRPPNSSLSCTKIQREFGIMPSNWQMALDQLSNYFDPHDCN